MKTNTATRVLMLILGILLVIFGVFLFATPGFNAVMLGYLVSILMLVSGIAEIVFYATHHKTHAASGWLLADGILTAILGLLLLFMPSAQVLTMSIIFAVWVLFTGVVSFSGAFTAKSAGSHSWGWSLALGIIGILLGLWLMFDPMLSIVSIGYLLPAAFVFEGISAIAAFFSGGKQAEPV